MAYLGHLLIEKTGLIVQAMATQADGRAERDAGRAMLHTHAKATPSKRRTIGADKNYDTAAFVAVVRAMNVTPHVSQNLKRPGGSALDARTTRHDSYAQSQACRPRVERPFAWMKVIAWLRKVSVRDLSQPSGLSADVVVPRVASVISPLTRQDSPHCAHAS